MSAFNIFLIIVIIIYGIIIPTITIRQIVWYYKNKKKKELSSSKKDKIKEIKKKLFVIKKWVICAPEYNGSIPPILSNFIAWLSISGEDFRDLFNGQPIAIATFSGGIGLELLTSLRIQLVHLGSQVLGRQLLSSYSKEIDTKTIEDIIQRLLQMKKLKNAI